MSVPASFLNSPAPLLVVTDVGLRLVRRGLLASSDAAAARWLGARVLVFRHGPVVYELPAPPPGDPPIFDVTLHARLPRAR